MKLREWGHRNAQRPTSITTPHGNLRRSRDIYGGVLEVRQCDDDGDDGRTGGQQA